jgi:hypothetical protein
VYLCGRRASTRRPSQSRLHSARSRRRRSSRR